MRHRRFRPMAERLEPRQLLSASAWFEESGQELGTNTLGVEIGDLDGDGDLDLFAGCGSWEGGPQCTKSQVWLNDGSGQFSPGWSGGTPSISAVALGDLDGDGDLDAYLAKGGPPYWGFSNFNEVWLNDGQGNFEDTRQRLAGENSRDVSLGDVDGDGDLDAVTGGLANSGLNKIWLNDGLGKFTDNGQRPAPNCYVLSVALGDVDGDQDLDAWYGCGSSGGDEAEFWRTDLLYLNDGAGKFIDSGQKLDRLSTSDVQLGDLDGDGDLDAYLASGDQRGGNIPDVVWLNDGAGTFTDSGQRLGRSNGRSARLGDFDGDGDLDVIVVNGTTLGTISGQPNAIWLNDGSGVFTASQELGGAVSTGVALGDFDGDGDLDAFIANLNQGNQVWINSPRFAGDANGDGLFDSSDLIMVFAAGQYEDDIAGNSTWSEGDWNGDKEFDSADLILAFSEGRYE